MGWAGARRLAAGRSASAATTERGVPDNLEVGTVHLREVTMLMERDSLLTEVEQLKAENARLRAALVEITELDLEGDASFADALGIAEDALTAG